jgi:hypothetical protein
LINLCFFKFQYHSKISLPTTTAPRRLRQTEGGRDRSQWKITTACVSAEYLLIAIFFVKKFYNLRIFFQVGSRKARASPKGLEWTSRNSFKRTADASKLAKNVC